MNKSYRSILLILTVIFAVGLLFPKVEGYIREQLDSSVFGRTREGGPFLHNSPEEGKPWNNGSGFILKGPLPPL